MESLKLDAELVSPDGTLINRPHLQLDPEEAEILRMYQKFLNKHGLAEALYCKTCWEGSRDDGCRAFVTPTQILIECRCKIRTYTGYTF